MLLGSCAGSVDDWSGVSVTVTTDTHDRLR